MPSKFIVSLEFKLKIREETEEGNNFNIGVESSKPKELDTCFPLNVDHITDRFTEVLKQNIELLTGIFEEHHKKVKIAPPRANKL